MQPSNSTANATQNWLALLAAFAPCCSYPNPSQCGERRVWSTTPGHTHRFPNSSWRMFFPRHASLFAAVCNQLQRSQRWHLTLRAIAMASSFSTSSSSSSSDAFVTDKARIRAELTELMRLSNPVYLTTINDQDGFPETRAMMNLRNAKMFPKLATFFESLAKGGCMYAVYGVCSFVCLGWFFSVLSFLFYGSTLDCRRL